MLALFIIFFIIMGALAMCGIVFIVEKYYQRKYKNDPTEPF